VRAGVNPTHVVMDVLGYLLYARYFATIQPRMSASLTTR
jgi:hypothetical protein